MEQGATGPVPPSLQARQNSSLIELQWETVRTIWRLTFNLSERFGH